VKGEKPDPNPNPKPKALLALPLRPEAAEAEAEAEAEEAVEECRARSTELGVDVRYGPAPNAPDSAGGAGAVVEAADEERM
jgi:hypothetical protein